MAADPRSIVRPSTASLGELLDGIATCVVVGYVTSRCFPRANKDIAGLALGTRRD